MFGRPELAALLGDITGVGKNRIPAQAADMLMWHTRNGERDALDRDGKRRYWRMIEGGAGTARGRYGYNGSIPRDWLERLADGVERRRLDANGDAASGACA